MITAKHNPFINHFFKQYISYILKRNFHSIDIFGDIPDGDSSVLMIGNHFSWWDGFFAFYINNKMLKKKFHVMMLEEQLKKRKYFRGIGAFSIRQSSRTLLTSLNYASGLLTDPDNMLVVYPQGKIESSYIDNISFGKGVMKIWDNIPFEKPAILLYVALVDYFSYKRPSVNIYIKPLSIAYNFTLSNLESSYNDFYRACKTLQKT